MAKMTSALALRKNEQGRYRVTSRDVPERHQVSTRLFVELIAGGHVVGQEVVFDNPGGPDVRYRILPADPEGSKDVIDFVLVGSDTDTDDTVGGQASWDEWILDGGVTTKSRAGAGVSGGQ